MNDVNQASSTKNTHMDSPHESTSPKMVVTFRDPKFRVLLLVGALIVATLIFFMVYVSKQSQEGTADMTTKTAQPLLLSLQSPTEDSVVTDDTVIVQGKTLPNTTAVFYTETDENSVESDASGNFQGEILLTVGINTLTVVVYGKNGEEKSVVMDIVYNPES